MFDAILRFSVKKKLFVGLTTLFLLIGGIYSMLTLPIDAVPDITNNQVQIVTVSPTLAPQEVEQLITMPVEIAMSNIMNVTEIRSVSRFGDDIPQGAAHKYHIRRLNGNISACTDSQAHIRSCQGRGMNMRDMIMNMKRPEKDMPVKFRLKKHWRKQSDCRRLRLSRVFLPM